jgi:hypothetical protein
MGKRKIFLYWGIVSASDFSCFRSYFILIWGTALILQSIARLAGGNRQIETRRIRVFVTTLRNIGAGGGGMPKFRPEFAPGVLTGIFYQERSGRPLEEWMKISSSQFATAPKGSRVDPSFFALPPSRWESSIYERNPRDIR